MKLLCKIKSRLLGHKVILGEPECMRRYDEPTWHADAAVPAALVDTRALVHARVAQALVHVRLAPRAREALQTEDIKERLNLIWDFFYFFITDSAILYYTQKEKKK